MSWRNERWAAIKDGIREKRYIIWSLVAFFVGAIDSIAGWLEAHGMTGLGQLTGFPSWIWGVVLFFALIAWWMLEYAVRLRRQLSPKLTVEFGGAVETQVKPATALPWQVGNFNRREIFDASDKGPVNIGVAVKLRDAAYIVAACNAYPKLQEERAELVAALRALAFDREAGGDSVSESRRETARALLRKLGEES